MARVMGHEARGLEPELDHGRLRRYALIGVGLGVTGLYLYLRKIILGYQGREIGLVKMGAGSPGRRLVQKSRGAAVWTWRKDALQGI